MATGLGSAWTIGMIDTGIDTSTFTPQGWTSESQYTAAAGSKDTSVGDRSGHGTQVARIMLGLANNGHPGGVSQYSQLLSARFLSDDNAAQPFSADGSFTATAQWLIDKHAEIVNVSSGKLRWSDDAGRQELYDGFARLAVSGALMVVSAGDDIGHEPSALGRLPLSGADPQNLRDRWLVVGAVSSEQPQLISAYSNACGIAKDICLMAPGDVKTVTPGVAGLVDGHSTDFATAQVSAAAAMLRNLYGYVDIELTRQILLGTTTDLGAPGVDDVYGYGLLNIEKAVRGPGRFDWGDVQINLSLHNGGFAGEWSNDISGEGGLVIRGGASPRLMWLSGHNTYTGDTIVGDSHTLGIFGHQAGDLFTETNGHLVAAGGSSFGGDIHVNSGSLNLGFWGDWPKAIGDTVTVDGSISNHALVTMPYNATIAWAPRNMSITIGGDYTQSADAALGIYLGAVPLKIGGTASLAGELRILGTWSNYVFSTRADVLEAAAVEGAFNRITWTWPSYLVNVTAHYETDRVWLELERTNVVTTAAALGLTPAAMSGAGLLEGAFGKLDGALPGTGMDPGTLSAAASLQTAASPGQLERSLSTLSGELYAKDTQLALLSLEGSRHALESRLESTNGPLQPRTWMQTYRQQGGGGAIDLQSSGWTLGTDVTTGAWTIGVAMTSTQGNAWHGLRNDRDNTRLFEGQWYAQFALGDGGFLLGSMGYGQGQRQLQREVDLVSASYLVGSEQGTSYFTANLQAGMRLRWGMSQVTPYIGVQGLQLQREAFHEVGAAGFGLRSQASDSTVALGLAGARWQHALRPGNGKWDLQARLEWQRVIAQSGVGYAGFSGIDGAWIPLYRPGLPDQLGILEVGIQRLFGERSGLGVTLGMRHSAQEKSGTAMLEWTSQF